MRIVNLDEWDRIQHYKFFSGMDYPQTNISMNIDITNFLSKVKEKKLPFYYAMIYASMTVLNEVEEFRYRVRDGQVIVHDMTHPSFTEMTPGSDLFKFVTVNLEGTLEDFVRAAKNKVDAQTEYFPFSELVRDDLVYITCIPWISFTQLNHTITLRKDDAAPRISWGKYYKEADKILLPYSVQVNHAFADGIHIGRYVEKLQAFMDSYK